MEREVSRGGTCPACVQDILLGPGTEPGARTVCPNCGAYLEVLSLSPVQLDWAFDGPVGHQQYDDRVGQDLDHW